MLATFLQLLLAYKISSSNHAGHTVCADCPVTQRINACIRDFLQYINEQQRKLHVYLDVDEILVQPRTCLYEACIIIKECMLRVQCTSTSLCTLWAFMPSTGAAIACVGLHVCDAFKL